MPLWWTWDQDREWSKSHWSKWLNDDATLITWQLEVRTDGPRRLLIGELVIRGDESGALTLALMTDEE